MSATRQCLSHALDLLVERGGWLSLCRSHHWDVLHAVWQSPDRSEMSSYVPPDELGAPWHAVSGYEGYEHDSYDAGDRRITPNGVVLSAALFLVLAVWWWVARAITRWSR